MQLNRIKQLSLLIWHSLISAKALSGAAMASIRGRAATVCESLVVRPTRTLRILGLTTSGFSLRGERLAVS
ncbi:hypothetical protein C7S18_23635 (plasmid) [Ahniella affigens]|uniref:ESPR domain-containing protein n=1 Tax=Ahniella affigens TaxID=2021234 RepID=A0A2P1PZM2_9GAMM|nr:hypothetical protein C7S18_23635 [Ahniella affigens]